jgi:hypothetical protein
MAKNRKKRGLVPGSAAPAKPVEPVKVEPVVKRGPTPKKVKVKRPKYQRPPRVAPRLKPPETDESAKPLGHAARTLRHSVAKTLLKPGAEEPERPGVGRI